MVRTCKSGRIPPGVVPPPGDDLDDMELDVSDNQASRKLPTALAVLAAAMLFTTAPSWAEQAQPSPSPSASPAATSPASPEHPASAPTGEPGSPVDTRPYQPRVQNLVIPPPVTLPAPDFVPADVPATPLTLMEAVHIALIHQPNVTVAVAGVEASQGRTQQVRSGSLPTVSLGFTGTNVVSSSLGGVNTFGTGGLTAGATPGATTQGGGVISTTGATAGGAGVNAAATSAALGTNATGFTGTGTGLTGSNGYVLTASLRQLVFDFNRTRDLIRQSMAQERSAYANLSRVQQDLVLQVKQGYFQLIQNARLVRVQETNLSNQQEHLRLAEARYRAGLGLPSDVVRAQTAVADAIFNLNQAQNTASISRVNLAVLMGIDPRIPIDVQMEGQAETLLETGDPNALFRLALEQRPEILQAVANLQGSQFGLRAAKTSNAPSVFATANYFVRGDRLTSLDANTFSVGFQVNWAIFDAGLTAGRVREARANELSFQAQLVAARQNVMSDVAQAYLNLRTAEQRLVTSASQVQNAEESVRLITGRYRAGLGTFLDVLDAEAALVTAETNQVNAQSAVDQARASLARALGMPLPDVAGAGTAVPPKPPTRMPVPSTEGSGASPIPVHPGAPSNAPGAPAARGTPSPEATPLPPGSTTPPER